MKTVKFINSHVMTNLLFLLQVILGVTCALLSAGIEYSVFNGLLVNVVAGTPVSPVPMSVLCVLCLEGTKVSLHMYIEIAEHRCKNLNLPVKRAKKILIALIAASLACTFVWSIHVLYSGVVDADDGAYLADVEEINATYNNSIERLRNSENAAIEDYIAPYKERYELANTEAANYEVSNYSTRRHNETLEEKQRLEAIADTRFAEYEKAKADAPNIIRDDIEAQIVKLETQRDQELQERKDIITTNEGANKYLHVVLMAAAHYVFGFLSYTPQAYFMVVMLFAVGLAWLLESIIGFSMGLVALSEADWDKLLQTDRLPNQSHTTLRMIVAAFLVSTVSTILFLTYCMFQDLGVEPHLTFMALVVFAAVNIVIMLFYKDTADSMYGNTQEKDKPESSSLVSWPKIKSEVTIMAVKSSLSFVAFVFLGTIFGNSFQELTLPAVGMTIGSAGGHLIHLPKPKNA